jgi:diguanylate cyclase (GGDEF)-like protein
VDAAFDMNITSLQDEIGRNIGRLIVIHDITDRKQLEEELRDLSLVDELTGLSNRRGFYVLATQFINMSNRMDLKAAVIFADLDWLKMINDSYGHAEGDQALIDTANLLRRTFRSSDIIARLSGDEFAILATESKSNLKEGMLERFKRKLAKLNSDTNRKYPLSISFGVAHYYPDHPRSLEVLMQEADKAMYEEKLIKKGSLNE